MEIDHNSGNTMQAPVITVAGFPRLSAAGTIDVTKAKSIAFDADASGLKVNYGSSINNTSYWSLQGGDAFAVKKGATTLYVDGACGYLLS